MSLTKNFCLAAFILVFAGSSPANPLHNYLRSKSKITVSSLKEFLTNNTALNLNELDEDSGQSALEMVLERYNIPLGLVLLEAGADVHGATSSSQTLLYDWVTRNLQSAPSPMDRCIVAFLINYITHHGNHNVDVVSTITGYTAMTAAMFAGRFDYVRMLYEAGANPFDVGASEYSAMGIALAQNNQEMVQLFQTPLDQFIEHNKEEDKSVTTSVTNSNKNDEAEDKSKFFSQFREDSDEEDESLGEMCQSLFAKLSLKKKNNKEKKKKETKTHDEEKKPNFYFDEGSDDDEGGFFDGPVPSIFSTGTIFMGPSRDVN